jgi:hypothetical protein
MIDFNNLTPEQRAISDRIEGAHRAHELKLKKAAYNFLYSRKNKTIELREVVEWLQHHFPTFLKMNSDA